MIDVCGISISSFTASISRCSVSYTHLAGVWFTGFSPIEEPRWVISVYVADGSEGSAAAVAVFREIIDGLAVLEGI